MQESSFKNYITLWKKEKMASVLNRRSVCVHCAIKKSFGTHAHRITCPKPASRTKKDDSLRLRVSIFWFLFEKKFKLGVLKQARSSRAAFKVSKRASNKNGQDRNAFCIYIENRCRLALIRFLLNGLDNPEYTTPSSVVGSNTKARVMGGRGALDACLSLACSC